MHSKDRDMLRERLLKKLREAFVFSEEPIYTLSSGRKSRFYIDCKKVTLDAEGAFLVGRLLLDEIEDLDVDAVGGMTIGADPLAVATALLSSGTEHQVGAFIVRKEPKPHGDAPYIEGNLPRGSRVVVVDDVLTGGRSTIQTIQILREAGCQVAGVVVLVDRKEGGRERLEALGIPVRSLFTVADLLGE